MVECGSLATAYGEVPQNAGKTTTCPATFFIKNKTTFWKRGRVVEGNSLENCHTRNGIEGSNPSASAKKLKIVQNREKLLSPKGSRGFESFRFRKKEKSSLLIKIKINFLPILLIWQKAK